MLGTIGCYAYLPARDANALVGRRASLELTDSGSVVLGSRIGQGITGIEGSYLGDSSGSFLLAVAVTRQRNGAESDWKGEHVGVPRSLVSSIAERELSTSRSIFAGALATVGIIALTTALRGRSEGGQGGTSTGPAANR